MVLDRFSLFLTLVSTVYWLCWESSKKYFEKDILNTQYYAILTSASTDVSILK